MNWIVEVIVPVSVAVVLPVLIVWIVFRASSNRDNKNAEIIIKAIENNSGIDADKIANALGKQRHTPRQILQARLQRGCMYTFVGIACGIYTLVSSHVEDTDPDLRSLMLLATFIFMAIGLAYLVVFFATRKSVDKE